MKFGSKEITDLDDWALTAAHHNCGEAMKLRDKASQHDKFNKDGKKPKMEFPPPNPNFIKLKNEIENEMRKRKLIT